MTSSSKNTAVNATVLSDTSNFNPIAVAHFTNGTIKKSGCLSFGQFAKKGDDRKRKKTVLVAESETMSYIGEKTIDPDARDEDGYCRYYVGVVDRAHGKIAVYDSHIIQMEPKLPNFQEKEEKETISLSETINKTYKQKIDDLTASFGSKKKRQAMDSRLRNEIRGEALEKALSSAVDNAYVKRGSPTETPTGNEDAASSLIPPCNKDAERPQDVYSLNDLINEEEMEILLTPAKEYFDCTKDILKTWRESEKFSKYILNHLAVLPSVPESRWHKSKILMYLNYLMKLYLTQAKDIKSRAPLPPEWPDVIKKKLLNNFTQQVSTGSRTTRCVPSRLKDKLVLQILVVCLILDEYELPLNDLQKDLKLGAKSMETHIRALGCKLKVQKITAEDGQKLEFKFALLTLPLTFGNFTKKAKKQRR